MSSPATPLNLAMLKKMLRYGVSSAVALGVDVGVMVWLANVVGLHYLAAAGIGFTMGCLVTYIMSVTLVFDDQSGRSANTTFGLFFLVGILGLILNHCILYLGVDLLGFVLLTAKACSALTVFWFNFFVRGMFVFKDPDLAIKKK